MPRKIVFFMCTSILLLSCFGVSLKFIKPVRAATTWTVDDDGPADFSTIWDALTAANSGDTIYVYNGTYQHFPVNKNVSLVGESRDSTIIDGVDIDVTIRGHVGFSISGFTIQNGGTGILLYETSGSNISDNVIINNYWHGIILNGVNNTIINGNVVANNTNGVALWSSFDNLLSGNTITNSVDDGMYIGGKNNTLRNNNMTGNRLNLNVMHASSVNEIDVSNTVNGKPVYYWIDEQDKTVPLDAGYVALINCTYITVKNLSLTNNGQGLFLVNTNNSIIANNKIANNYYGIYLYKSSNNSIYHNNVIENTQQASILYESFDNAWDDGYPLGGNYWSDHNPPDVNLDQIGDTPYVIDEDNVDRYPLIYPHGFVPDSDVDGDEVVNMVDITTAARAYGCEPGDSRWNPIIDMDINETIDILDIATVAKDYGKTV